MKVIAELFSLFIGLVVFIGIPHYLDNHWLCFATAIPSLVVYANISDKFEETLK